MTDHSARTLIRRYYEELWNPWNLALIDELIAPDILFRGSLGVDVHGRPAFRDYVLLVRAAFPDFHNTIESLVVEADAVAARLTYRGTHRGRIFDIAPTGRSIQYAGAAFFRIHANRIAEGWVLGDRFSLMSQLSAPPEPLE